MRASDGASGGSSDVVGAHSRVLGYKLRAPRARPEAIERTALIDRLAAPAGGCIVLRAPAGSGKTTLAHQWAAAGERPFGWLNLDSLDDDPASLLTHLVGALAGVADLPHTTRLVEEGDAWDLDRAVLALGTDLVGAQPFVLVLDDVHRLESSESLRLLDRLIDVVPDGASVAVLTREPVDLHTSRRLLAGDLVELTVADLRLTEDESLSLLGQAGRDLAEDVAFAIAERCDGWPAGLGLAVAAISEGAEPESLLAGMTSVDTRLSEYLQDEVLAQMSTADREFVLHTSVMARLNGSKCDHVLQTEGSADVLRRLVTSGNLLIHSYEGADPWYRYHQVWRDSLVARLRATDPELESSLRRRASEWLAANGWPEHAFTQAMAAGDEALAARLVHRQVFTTFVSGRTAMVDRWLESFDLGTIRATPELAVAQAWSVALRGEVDALSRWLGVLEALDQDQVVGGRSPLWADVAAILMATMVGGIERAATSAHRLMELGPTGSEWWGVARYFGFMAELGSGRIADPVAGFEQLEFDVRPWPGVRVAALANLALVHLRQGSSGAADAPIELAVRLMHDLEIEHYSMMAPVHAVQGLHAARRGDQELAERAIATGSALAVTVALAFPRGHIHVRLILAEAALASRDVDRARRELATATGVLREQPAAAQLATWAADIEGRIRATSGGQGGPVRLSPAELRVLELLATHLSLAEIGDRLYVSRNTVKSHSVAIYRKLGASGRSAAVDEAVAQGLIRLDRTA